MKNILLLTTIYPLPSSKNRGTPVCHYFTREWVKLGYKVKVIHFLAVYPIFFYWAACLFRNLIAAKTGAVVYVEREKKDVYFEWDGVSVCRFPIFKPIPHGGYFQRTINKQICKIIEDNKKTGFIPDIIVGHFPNPQLQVVSELKTYYPQAKTAIVMHGDNETIQRIYKHNYKDLIEKIDLWGFRSCSVQREFERRYGKRERTFLCYSGIPKEYLLADNKRKFDAPLKHFLYVGELIKRKYPESLVPAIASACKDFDITYVGAGAEKETVLAEAEKCGVVNHITFTGKIPRDQILQKYDNSDCMIMISSGEAFGLVYLEAMARGCITIGSRDEGIDGIIQHGVNGFLCKAGDAQELSEIIKHINSLSPEEKLKISNNAMEIARDLTDEKAAKRYLDDLLNL